MSTQDQLYGLMAEFDDPTAVVEATKHAYAAGYRHMDAYSPYPIEELHHALGVHGNRLPLLVLVCGIAGALGGYALEYWSAVIAYPVNVGGRPLHSWPAFIPVAFETTVLFAALGAVVGMIVANGLPMPYHPVFNVPEFQRASRDGFFLCIEAVDPMFDVTGTRRFLESLGAKKVSEVEP
jgi:hypothetical protein